MVDYLSLDAEGGPGLQTALSGPRRADLSCLGKPLGEQTCPASGSGPRQKAVWGLCLDVCPR